MYEPGLSLTLLVWYREKLPGIMPLPAPIGEVRRAFIHAYGLKPSGPFSCRFFMAINKLREKGFLASEIRERQPHRLPVTYILPPPNAPKP